MNIQIEKLLIHRRDGVESFSYPFGMGKVNIITGDNSNGKSSFIDAVDYALCSDKCGLDNKIRHSIDFVGVILCVDGERHLFARRIPDRDDNSLLCYHVELNGTDDGFVTENFTKQTGISCRAMLPEINRLIGVDVATNSPGNGKTKRLSIRTLLDIVFQEYEVISTKKVLFRNGANGFSSGLLKSWLPFVVGITTPAKMSAKIEHDDADARYKKILHELTSARALSERWVAELDTELENCRRLGLLAPEERFPDGVEGQLLAFEKVKKNAGQFFAATPNSQQIDETCVELSKLEQRQQELSIQLQTVQDRIDLLHKSEAQVNDTLSVTREFEKRLKLAEWLGEVWQDERSAPLFATSLGKTGADLRAELEKLTAALRDYQSTLTNKGNLAAYHNAVRRELNTLEVKRRKLEADYRAIAEKINSRAREDGKARELLDSQRAAYMQIGRIDKMITFAHEMTGHGASDAELEKLKAQRDSAKERVKAEEDAELARAVDFAGRVNENLTAKVRELDASPDMQMAHSEFDIGKLDILLKYPNSEEWLSGRSGSNSHIAFHIAITAALEETLVDRAESPLPSFVFYDQPTQSKGAAKSNVALDQLLTSLEKSVAVSKEKNAKGWQPIIIDLVESARLQGIDPEKYHVVANLVESGGFVPPAWWREDR